MPMWSAPRQWPGETVFVLAGGPSVNDLDLSLLRGRRVIAINSAWKTYPDADVLFFADARWWRHFKPEFAGEIVTTATDAGDLPARIRRMAKIDPSAISTNPDRIALKRSSVTGAINLAVHFGAALIPLLGVDGRLVSGVRHNHDDRYPWPMVKGCFDDHAAEFRRIAPSIPVPIVNCSPASDLGIWPKMTLEQALEA